MADVSEKLQESVTGEEAEKSAGRMPLGGIHLSNAGQRLALPVAWGVLVLVFSVIPATSATYPTLANFSTIFGAQTVIAIVTLGLLIPLTAGDYDLSVAYTLALSSMVVAVLNVNHGWPIGFAILAALGVGLTIGAINGALVVLLGLEPFIVTLGTGTFIYGVDQWISNSNTISGISEKLVKPVIIDHFLGLPLLFFYGLALAAIIWYVFEFTPVGRRLLVVGQGRNVARLSGIHVGRMRWGALAASGLVAAAAGVLYAGTSGAADPTSGTLFLLPAYAAAFLGATTIMPGRFNPWGTLIAVYFLVSGITGLEQLGVSTFVTDLFYGGALVVAIALSRLAQQWRGARRRA